MLKKTSLPEGARERILRTVINEFSEKGYSGARVLTICRKSRCWCRRKGRGFVAVGLVIVARWNPFYVLPVVLLFGLSETATLRLQAMGLTLSPYLISCLPYVVCLICVIVVSLREGRIGGMPAQLGSVFGKEIDS